jgi:hypothetical protein
MALNGFFGVQYFKKTLERSPKRDKIVRVSLWLSFIPLLFFIGFIYFFTQGGSNVVQFSDPSLWSFWFWFWPLSFILASLAGLISLILLALDLNPRARPYFFMTRLFSIVSFLGVFWILRLTIPDA